MPIYSRTNQYRGINAHLHSRLQNETAGWEVFHGSHIVDLARAIDEILPEGYLVEPEKSLQVREYHPTTGEEIIIERTRRPKPDLTIYDFDSSSRVTRGTQSSTATPTLTLPVMDALETDAELFLRALVIRKITGEYDFGEAVTWIELLSPTNKPPHRGYLQYIQKRNTTLQSGIAVIELDYLHETRATIAKLPSYPNYEENAYPYWIIITNPRPSLENGTLDVYGVRVDEPLPVFEIPLSNNDAIALDLNAVYNRTFSSLGSYAYRVDYENEPESFQTYWEQDRERIRQRMQAVQRIVADGGSLETPNP